jgi:hypothetical protein
VSYDLKELHRLEREATRPKSTIGADAVFSKALTAAAPELLARMERLEAVARAARAQLDYAEDSGDCAVCNGHTGSTAVTIRTGQQRCIDDCPGRTLRRKLRALDALTTAEPR